MAVTNQAFSSATIFEAIRVRLRDVTSVADEYVRLVLSDDYKYTQEETLIAIRPLGCSPSVNAGGGRRARPVSRLFRVYLHKRSSLDFSGDDRVAVPLVFNLEDSVFNALDDHYPVDTNGNVLTIEPLHPGNSFGGPPLRKANEDNGEFFSVLVFEVNYLLVNETPKP